MNWADWVIVAILAVSVLIGLWRGFVSEMLSLVIWIGGFGVAWAFGPVVASFFEHSIKTPELRQLAGYGICIVSILVIGAVVKAIVRRMLITTGLSGLDRGLGLLFGFARGVLLVALMVFLLGLTGVPREPWWQSSVLLPQFQGVAVALGQQVPASAGRFLHPSPEVTNQLPAMPNASQLPDLHQLPDMSHLLDGAGSNLKNSVNGGQDPAAALRALLSGPTSTSSAPARPASTNAPAADPAAVP